MSDTLTLGSFNLTDPSGSAWKAGVEAEGTSKGAPVPIDLAVDTWLQDGSIVLSQGYDNREVPIRVRMWATSLTALNQAEAALHLELRKPNLLTWTPSSGPAAVFEVINSSMVQDDTFANADLLEATRLIRTYNIRLTCRATTRSATETITPALPTTGATTNVLDACSATTGWSGTVNGGSVSPSTSGGSVILTQSAAFGAYTLALQKTFAATTTSTKYLVVDWQPSVFSGGTSSDLVAIGDGATLPLIAQAPSPTSGYVRSWFYVAASSLAVTRFEWTSNTNAYVTPVAPARILKLDNIAISDASPSFGTGRQQARTIAVAGSARAQGALAIESSGTAGLGDTMIYTYPADDTTKGYAPSLRQFRSAGNTVTSDSAMVSGSRESIGGSGVTFTIPLGLLPWGMYSFFVRLGTTSPGGSSITYTYQTTLGGNQLGSTTKTSSVYALTTTYQIFLVSRLLLPTVDVDRQTPAALTINIASAYIGVAQIDEAWLFNTTIGQFIRVDCGTGTAAVGGPARRVFVEPASLGTPRPVVRIGHSADRSDAYFPPNLSAWQPPEFLPPKANLFFVTTGATDAAASFRSAARWHTNPSS